MQKRFAWTWVAVVVMAICGMAHGQAQPAPASGWPPPTDEAVVTQHQITVNGNALKYTARAGFLSLRDEFNKTHGRIFYVYYKLDEAQGKAVRPVTFAWNGGPGSNSSLLQLAALGPFRVKDLDEYASPPPPYALAENESTWLDTSDLVFVDPVGTGYSYPTDAAFGKEFWSRKGDVDSITEFIRVFLAQYDYRRDTPIFLIGESYGTLRAAGVAGELSSKNVNLAGVVLISTALELHSADPDKELISLIPSYTAAAFVHKKLPADLQNDFDAAVKKSEEWAISQYSVALLQGDRLSSSDRSRVAKEMSRLTGLGEDFIVKHDLRIGMEEFAGQLLQDKKQVLGHYDVRATAASTSPNGEYDPTHDPSLDTHGTGSLVVPYFQSQLNIKTDALYAGPFGGRWPPPTQHRGDWMSVKWDWSDTTTVDSGAALARALRTNKSMRVLVISGLYDLATPFFGTEQVFAHMGLDPDARSRTELVRYKAGHMAYLDPSNRKQLKHDFVSLVKQALSSPAREPSE